MRVKRGAKTLFERCQSAFGETVFHSFLCEVFGQFLKVFRVRLKSEVLESSKLLKDGPNLRAKVRVRLKLECGLI